MLATYMWRMRNNNLEIRIAASPYRPFCIPYTDKWTYLVVKNFASFYMILIAVNALSLKYEEITKPDLFPDFITDILLQCICWSFWAFLPTEMTDFHTLSYTSASEISCL